MALSITAWIGAPPSLRNEMSLLIAFLQDAVALMRPYGIEYIWTDEPRKYRLTHEGMRLLSEALHEHSATYLIFDADSEAQMHSRADLSINLHSDGLPE